MRQEVIKNESPPKKKKNTGAKNKKNEINKNNQSKIEDEGVVDLGESYADNVCYFCGKGDLRSGLDEHF